MKDHLREPSADVVVEHIYRRQICRDSAVFRELVLANLAHVLMLETCSIIGSEEASSLLRVLLELLGTGVAAVDLDEQMESLYYSFEWHVTDRVGSEIGGKLHTARSRNDLGATVSRMAVRGQILSVAKRLCVLRSTLLQVATRNTETVMTGYTHLQPAQPITAAHYLAGIEEALERDTTRLFGAYTHTNRSCLGAGAFAGTGFPIDRMQTAGMLGFDGIITNTLDAVAARDYVAEYLSALSILATTLSRLAQDLYVWSTQEFAIVRLPDRFVGTSSIMPQKRNAFPLESVKGRLSHVIAASLSSIVAMKNTSYSNVIDVNTESTYMLGEGTAHTIASLDLLAAVCAGMEFNGAHAQRAAAANYSTATELADTLVREGGLTFRDAHRVVAETVRVASDQGMEATGISPALVASVANKVIGHPIAISEMAIVEALDPLANVCIRSHPGGPAPHAVRTAIDRAAQKLEQDKKAVVSREGDLLRAEHLLCDTARQRVEVKG